MNPGGTVQSETNRNRKSDPVLVMVKLVVGAASPWLTVPRSNGVIRPSLIVVVPAASVPVRRMPGNSPGLSGMLLLKAGVFVTSKGVTELGITLPLASKIATCQTPYRLLGLPWFQMLPGRKVMKVP